MKLALCSPWLAFMRGGINCQVLISLFPICIAPFFSDCLYKAALSHCCLLTDWQPFRATVVLSLPTPTGGLFPCPRWDICPHISPLNPKPVSPDTHTFRQLSSPHTSPKPPSDISQSDKRQGTKSEEGERSGDKVVRGETRAGTPMLSLASGLLLPGCSASI